MEIPSANIKDALLLELEIAKKERVNNITESILTTKDIIKKAKENLLPDVEAQGQNLMGLLLMIVSEFKESIKYSNLALSYFRDTQDRKGIADAIFNIASSYYKTDDYFQGLELLYECLQLYSENNDFSNKARVLKSIGTIHEFLDDLTRAIENYENCVFEAKKANDPNTESNAYNSLSGAYLKQNKIRLAQELAEKSILIKKSTGDIRGLGYSIYARGKVHLKLGEHKLAIVDFEESIAIHQKMNERLGEGMALNKLAIAFYTISEYAHSIDTLKKATILGEKFNLKLIVYKSHQTLYLCYKALENTSLALFHLELYTNEKEKTTLKKNSNVIKSYELIYKIETLEKEAKIQKEYYSLIEAKNTELDSFFYRVSHDLKGPISSLLGLSSIIDHEYLDEKAMKYFNMFNSQFVRINMIVMDLIELTKMSNINENKVEIQFEKLIFECINSYEYISNFDKITFTIDIEPKLNFHSQWVIVNTILQNLIENAIKYSNDTIEFCKVTIVIAKDDTNLLIKVIDNGNGISLPNQSKIFNMFFRIDTNTEGTGLGLYILKRAVERLHGKINLKSEEGAGTLFEVVLPY